MKVVLLNGSPHEAGCTFTALSEVAKELNKNGVETEILQLLVVIVMCEDYKSGKIFQNVVLYSICEHLAVLLPEAD